MCLPNGIFAEGMRILVVFGTRPEAIKLAPLIIRLRQEFEIRICVTGQHREMLDQVLRVFNLVADDDLQLMRPNQSLAELTARVINGVSRILEMQSYQWLVVQGDTTSSMAAALAAFYQKVPVVHIEAGLRTYNKHSPFPEELNRQLTSRVADLHFAPTNKSRDNLLSEGILAETIHVTGNTVIDALQWVLNHLPEPGWGPAFDPKQSRMILVTGHRRENFGIGFENICEALKQLALENKEVEIIYPVHLNPNVQKPVKEILDKLDNVHLLKPLDYSTFVHLMNRAYLILTDSGGVQEEAPSLGKPVLVMRDTTERLEALEAGTVKLVGTESKRIVEETGLLLDNKKHYQAMSFAHNPYGDGTASEQIIQILQKKETRLDNKH